MLSPRLCSAEQRTAEQQNIEPQNFEGWFRSPRRRRYNPYEPEASLNLYYVKIDRIPSFEIRDSRFEIRDSLFDIRFFELGSKMGQ